MATVPRATSPNVSPGVLPGVRLNDTAPTSSINARQIQQAGGALTQLGTTGMNIAVDMQERENAALVFAAETNLKDAWSKHEAEVKQRKGAEAWGATEESEKWFADAAKQHAETLTNGRQRELFNMSFTRLRQAAMPAVAEYETRERDSFLAEAAQSSIVSSINIAASSAADGADDATLNRNVAGIKRDVTKRIDVLTALNGWGPEKRDLEANRYVTMLHKQVIGALVDNSPDQAQTYYEANKAEIDGTERAEVEHVLKVGGVRQQAQNAIDEIFSKGMSQSEALAYARKEYKGEAEDEIVRRVRDRFAEVDMVRERGQRQAADSAWKTYSQSRNLDSIPTTVLAAMDGKDIEAIRTHDAALKSGTSIKTDPATYYGLSVMAATEPTRFQSLDLRRYVGALSQSDFQEMVKRQTGSEQELKDAATFQQQLEVTHSLLGFTSSDKEKKGAFDKLTTDALNAEQTRLGKKLNYEERQKVIDRFAMQGEIPGLFNDNEGRFYEFATDPEKATKFEPEISDADRAQIVSMFAAKQKREPTDEEVMTTYKLWKGL